MDQPSFEPCTSFSWRARLVFRFELRCRVAREGRDLRPTTPVLRTAEGEQLNLRLLLLLRFCSVVPFLSSVLLRCVLSHHPATSGHGGGLHLFLRCVKVFCSSFEVSVLTRSKIFETTKKEREGFLRTNEAFTCELWNLWDIP